MLLLVTAVKLIAEIALMAFAGRFVVGLLAGSRRDANPFYGILKTMTSPFVRAARWITPAVVLDRHIPFAAFLLMAFVWIAATFAKIDLCVRIGVHLCR